MVSLVYFKENKIRVLPYKESKLKHEGLIALGYVHTDTIDPCKVLENIFNKPENIKHELYKFKKNING